MAMRRTFYHPVDRSVWHAFDEWKRAARESPMLGNGRTEEEWRLKARRYHALLESAFQNFRVPLENSPDWDVAIWPTVSQIQNAGLYYLLTRDPRALPPAVEGLAALESCRRPYWTYSSCLGVLDMDLRTAHGIYALALMRATMGGALPKKVRERLKKQAVDRILLPALEVQHRKAYPWTKSRANWRIVLPSSFAIAAMAFAEECPVYRELVAFGINGVLAALGMGDAEGGWNEGPAYWDYGMTYAVRFAWCLKHFTNGAVNLFRHPFLARTGDFYLSMHVRPGKIWNWSDGKKQTASSLALTGLARACQNPVWQWLALSRGVKSLEQLWLLDPWLKQERPPAGQSVRRLFPGLGVVVWRGGFGPRDYYIGIKAGDIPHLNHHCHMDFGHFVLHVQGRELLAEPNHWPYPYEGGKKGGDRKAKPGFYDPSNRRWLRWDFDNVAAIGHNMVTLEGGYPHPSPGAHARVRIHKEGAGFCWALVDATPVYRPLAWRVRRFFVLLEPDVLLLVDEIRSSRPIRARVNFHPAGTIEWGPDWFRVRNGRAELRTCLLFPAAKDHLILGQEERLTTYQPPEGLLQRRLRSLYVENLYRKRRILFVTAFHFGLSRELSAQIGLEGRPATEDCFRVQVQRQERTVPVTFDLKKGQIV